MSSLTLRDVPAMLLAGLHDRATRHGWTVRKTAIYLLMVGLGHDPRETGKAGGLARAAALSPERRSEIARHAAFARHHTPRKPE